MQDEVKRSLYNLIGVQSRSKISNYRENLKLQRSGSGLDEVDCLDGQDVVLC